MVVVLEMGGTLEVAGVVAGVVEFVSVDEVLLEAVVITV